MTNTSISLRTFTNSKSLQDAINKFSNSEEKLILINIQSVTKAYDFGESLILDFYDPKTIQLMHLLRVMTDFVPKNIILGDCADFQVEHCVYCLDEINNLHS